MNNRQRAFIQEYLKDFNATRAAKSVGYSEKAARAIGSRLLTKANIAEAVKAEIAERAMGKEEVLQRIADIARGDMADLMDITPTGFILELMVKDENGNLTVNPKTKLIKKIKQKTTTILAKSEDGGDKEFVETELELYSAYDAQVTLGKYHKLWTDALDVTSGGEPIKFIEVIRESSQPDK